MRVIFIGSYPFNPDGSLTGPERPTLSLVRRVAKIPGYQVVVVLPFRLRSLFKKQNLFLDGRIKVISAHVRDLFWLIQKVQPQVIHLSGISYFGMLSLLFTRFYFKDIRTVYFAHGILAEESNFGESFPLLERICEFILIHGANMVVTASVASRFILLKHYKRTPETVKVIPYGLDSRLITKKKPDIEGFRDKHSISEKNIILFVARLVPLKGLNILIEGGGPQKLDSVLS